MFHNYIISVFHNFHFAFNGSLAEWKETSSKLHIMSVSGNGKCLYRFIPNVILNPSCKMGIKKDGACKEKWICGLGMKYSLLQPGAF